MRLSMIFSAKNKINAQIVCRFSNTTARAKLIEDQGHSSIKNLTAIPVGDLNELSWLIKLYKVPTP